MKAGPYWMRLSRFLMMTASWSTLVRGGDQVSVLSFGHRARSPLRPRWIRTR